VLSRDKHPGQKIEELLSLLPQGFYRTNWEFLKSEGQQKMRLAASVQQQADRQCVQVHLRHAHDCAAGLCSGHIYCTPIVSCNRA